MNFIHRWLHPHCPSCAEELRDSRICDSCETLKLEIERLRLENKQLLDRILAPPQIIEPPPLSQELKSLKDKMIPWNVRKQLLEQEDKHKAQLLKQQGPSIEELEKELDIVGMNKGDNNAV